MTDSARSGQEHLKLYQQFVDNYFSNVHLLNRAFSLKQEPSVILRRITEEKIEIAFDEFEIEYGGRRESFFEELQLEPTVNVQDIFMGRDCFHFALIGDSGQGKTCLLKHLCWKVNVQQDLLVNFLKEDPSTYYWNVEGLGDSEPVPDPTQAHHLGLYLNAQDLWLAMKDMPDRSSPDAIFNALAEAALRTCRTIKTHQDRLDKSDNVVALPEKEFKESLLYLVKTSRLLLFIDGLEHVRTVSRSPLLYFLLNIKTKLPLLFRVIMACRPVTLFRQNPPEDFIYLYMHSMASMTEKEREPLLENILTRVVRAPDDNKQVQHPPLTPRSRSGSDQNQNEHQSPLHEPLPSTSEINKVFDQRRPLRRQKILRYLSSPAMMAILTAMHLNDMDISSCLFQFYQQVMQMHDDFAATVPPLNILPNTTLYEIEVQIDERLMQKLCALVGFMYQCLLPYTWLSDFSIAKEVVKLLQIIVKNHHTSLAHPMKTEPQELNGESVTVIAPEWHPLLQDFAAHDVLRSPDKAARFIWDRVITRLASNGVCKCHLLDDEVEISFTDSSLAQFLSANFLSDDEFSRPILHCFEQIYHNPHIPPIFLWQEENYITIRNWTLVYEVMTSRKGFLWIANKVLDPSYKSLLEWLSDITRNGGYDIDDLGLIRFNLLLKMFALQEEERLLLKQPSPEVKIDNHTLIVELKEQFGLAFLSVLNDSSSAVALIEPAPACSLSCFSKNVINTILDKCVELLRRSNAFIITDLLLRFADYGHITDGVLGKIITIVTEEISRNQSKRPALKFLANFDQKFFDKRQRHIGLIISSLGALIEKDLDQETIEEAAHALTQLANRSLDTVKSEKKQREAIIPTSGAAEVKDHLPMLFTEEEWCMIVNSAITLLIDLVDMDFHLNMNNSKEIANEFEQKCRLFQCQNLPMIISFFEEPSCSSRLMGFALLGTTKKSNIVDRDSEDKEIAAQLTVLKLIAPHYSSDRALSQDITTDDPIVQCVSTVILETLGEAASILVADVQDLIKSKLDLLTQITKWVWRRIAPENRGKIFSECIKNANRYVRRDVIRLNASDEFILRENISQAEISLVFDATWNYREEAIVHKECFAFFGNLVKYAVKLDQKVKVMELIAKLLDKYGLANFLFSDSLLRITSELVEANKNNEEHRAVILDIITNRNIKKMITSFLSGPMSPQKKKLWFGNVLSIELLSQLIAINTEEIKEFLSYLNSKFPELRRTAVEVLKRARTDQALQIIQKCVEMIIKEDDYFAQRSIVVLLGILGRRKKSEIQQRVIDEMLKILELSKDPLKQEIALSVIMTIGPMISSNIAIRSKLLQILSDANVQSFAAMNKHSVAYKNKIKLTLTCIHAIQTIRIFEHEFVKHFFEMTEVPDMELRTALMVSLKYISKNVTAGTQIRRIKKSVFSFLNEDDLKRHEPIVEKLMKSQDPYLRELGLKIIRLFGPASIKRLLMPLVALLDDTEHYCRRQGLKTLTLLIKSELSVAQKDEKERQLLSTSPQQPSMTPPSPSSSPSSHSDGSLSARSNSSSHMGSISINNINTNNSPNAIHPAKLAALQYLPPVLKRLADMSPLVVVQALKIISLFRRNPKDKIPSPRQAEKVIEPEINDIDLEDDSDFERPTDEDVFYSTYVIEPNVERIIKPLYRRRFVNSIEVKIGVLDVLGTTPHLHSHLGALSSILNTENVTTLVEFSDTMRSEGVQILQYIPSFIQSIKAGSPLVRHLVRLAQHYERELTPVRCDSLFHVASIFQLLKHKEPNVRRLAIHLLGKKCELKPKFIPTLAQMWEDKNTKVRKEVIEVLGDVGKRHPSFIPIILQSIDVDSSNSLMVWRSLSLSWGMLIGSNASSDNEDELDDSSS